MCSSRGMLQSLAFLPRLLWLPYVLFGSGAAALATRGAVSGNSIQRVHPRNATAQVNVLLPEDVRRSQACVSNNVSLLSISPVPAADIPCMTSEPSLNGVGDNGRRVALFVLEDHFGAAKLRGEYMAAAFKSLDGWDALYVHKVLHPAGIFEYQPSLPASLIADLCVVVKFPKDGVEVCKAQKAKVIYWDILDSPLVSQLLAQPPNLDVIPPEVDFLVSPDAEFSAIMNSHLAPRTKGYAMGMQRSFPLYHSHTNEEVVSPLERFTLPYVCRVAIFVSDYRHSPSREDLLRVHDAVCQSPNVWSFAILTQVQQTKDGPVVESSMEDYWCPDRPQEMHDDCDAMDQITQLKHKEEFRNHHKATSCGEDQSKYHEDVHNRMVDVVIVAAESMESVAVHRPATRVLTWMSYGVPVTFTSGFSYDEIAEKWRYMLSGDSGGRPMPMSFPRSPWPPYLADHMYTLSNSSVRMGMRDKGLSIAAQFTTRAVAARLLAHFEKTLCTDEVQTWD